MLKVWNLVFLFFILLFVSCQERGDSEIPISDPPFAEICTLSQEKNALGLINSIDWVCDTAFVLCTDSQVYLYSFSGSLIRTIGQSGRAKFEYRSPRIVRSDGNRIFVWDGMLAKFIWYDIRGQVQGECDFNRGVSDFIVEGNHLWVYSSNKESNICIVCFDAFSGESVDQDFLHVGGGHHILIRWMSRAPMCVKDGIAWAMPKNKLELCRSDTQDIVRIQSSTFHVEDVQNPKAVISDRKKMEEYMCANSFVVSILPAENEFLVLCAEGVLLKTAAGLDRTNRYYTIYSVNPSSGASKKLIKFPQSSFSPDQMMLGQNSFYCISHKIENEEDIYCLEKLKI